MNIKRKENFQWLPKELHQLKYEAISIPQGSVRLVKKTQERKSSTCYLLITKGVTSSSPVPLKTRRERERTATAGSGVVQSGRPIFDDFFQHLWPYIGNNTANVVFQMVKRLWLIRIDQ
ncbi:hypothetical protein TNCV_3714621 [Trichonephila clavipes]|nr:hypothetical protein TNCV_3714621 [Trichonephila clavipes]